MNTARTFPALLEAFFTDRLVRQRQASPHTLASYRDTFCLLLAYAQQKLRKVYPVHVMTRKSFGLMTRKLSVTESQRSAQFPGTFSRRKLSVASANCAQVA